MLFLDLRPHLGHDLIHAAIALVLQFHRNVAGIRFGHSRQAKLQAGTPRRALHFGNLVQHLLNVSDDEVCFGQLKTQCQADYVPVRRLVGNQLFLLASILSHNLGRELQMAAQPPERHTTPKRMALWVFRELHTLRRTLFLRAGRLTRPNGELTLTLSANADVRTEFVHYLDALAPAA